MFFEVFFFEKNTPICSTMHQNALALGKKLTGSGGVGVIVENILR